MISLRDIEARRQNACRVGTEHSADFEYHGQHELVSFAPPKGVRLKENESLVSLGIADELTALRA